MTGTIRYHRTLNRKTMEFEERPEYLINGKAVSKAAYDRAFPEQEGCPMGPPLSGWPIISEAAAVHPKQRAEHEALCRAKGVPTDTTPQGNPVFRGRAHRKQYLKAFNFRDRNGGYGD